MSQLQQHSLLGEPRHKDNVQSQGCINAIWLRNFSCYSRSTNSCQSLAEGLTVACRCSFGGIWLLPSSDKCVGQLGGPIRPLNSCADGFSDGLQDMIMPPSVPPLPKCLCAPGFLTAWMRNVCVARLSKSQPRSLSSRPHSHTSKLPVIPTSCYSDLRLKAVPFLASVS